MSTENLQQNGSLPVDFHNFNAEIGSLKGSTASVVNEVRIYSKFLPLHPHFFMTSDSLSITILMGNIKGSVF